MGMRGLREEGRDSRGEVEEDLLQDLRRKMRESSPGHGASVFNREGRSQYDHTMVSCFLQTYHKVKKAKLT